MSEGHSSACVTTRSYRKGVFFFQILYSSATTLSSTSAGAAGAAEEEATSSARLAMGGKMEEFSRVSLDLV